MYAVQNMKDSKVVIPVEKKNGNLLHFFIFGYKRDLDTI